MVKLENLEERKDDQRIVQRKIVHKDDDVGNKEDKKVNGIQVVHVYFSRNVEDFDEDYV